MATTIERSDQRQDRRDPPILAVSADSHITEPPNCYTDYIDPQFRERAPQIRKNPESGGDAFYVDGFARPISLGLLAAAGIDPREINVETGTFEDLHRGGWDPKARLLDQDRDGVQAEFVYPTVGMLLCNHPDLAYKDACMWAYNRWLQEYVGAAPTRLYGLGQMTIQSPSQAVKDITRLKEMGFKGVMMPGEPETDEDYDDPMYDPLWQASVDLDMPLSFHILTGGMTKSLIQGNNFLSSGAGPSPKSLRAEGIRGPRIGTSLSVVRACQDIVSMFIFGRVFERNPGLKMVCVEADAGWGAHYMYRMDHFYNRHRFWMKFDNMDKLPSEYFQENVYLTFQDDWTAFQTAHMVNPKQLMWASDFPHSDSTWPWSQQLLDKHTSDMPAAMRAMILRDNAAELYGIPVH